MLLSEIYVAESGIFRQYIHTFNVTSNDVYKLFVRAFHLQNLLPVGVETRGLRYAFNNISTVERKPHGVLKHAGNLDVVKHFTTNGFAHIFPIAQTPV